MKKPSFHAWQRLMISVAVFLLFAPGMAQHETQAEWVFLLDGYNDTYLTDLEADTAGNSFFAVNYCGKLNIPALNKSLPPSRHIGAAFGKLDKNGNPLWVHAIESSRVSRILDLALAPDGDILLTGYCDGISRFPSPNDTILCGRKQMQKETNLPSFAFVARYSPAGECRWARVLGASLIEGQGVTANRKGEVFLSVHYSGSLRDGKTLLDSVSRDEESWKRNAVLKLNRMGEVLGFFPLKLITHYDGQHFSFSTATDAQDNLIIYGTFRGRIGFTPTDSLFNDNYYEGPDAFVAKYDSSGTFLWCRKIGGQSTQSISDIHIADDGRIFTTGMYSYECIITGGMNIVQGSKYEWKSGSSFFYCCFEPDGSLRFAEYYQQKGYNSSVTGSSLAMDSLGYIHLTGLYTDTLNFGSAVTPLYTNSHPGASYSSIWAHDSIINLQRDLSGAPGWGMNNRVAVSHSQVIYGGLYYEYQKVSLANGQTVEFTDLDYGCASYIYGKKIPPLPPIRKRGPSRPANHLTPLDPMLVCIPAGITPAATLWFPEENETVNEPPSPLHAAAQDSPCGVLIESWQARLAPNPAAAQTTLQLKGLLGNCKVEIISGNGALLFSQQVQVPVEEYAINLDLQPLALGVYFVTVSHQGYIKVLRLVKGE